MKTILIWWRLESKRMSEGMFAKDASKALYETKQTDTKPQSVLLDVKSTDSLIF